MLKAHSGQVSKSHEQTIASHLGHAFSIVAESEQAILLIHVSNTSHAYGGIRDSIRILSEASHQVKSGRKSLLSSAMLGIFLILGIYHLGLALQRPDAKIIFGGGICILLFCHLGSTIEATSFLNPDPFSYQFRHRLKNVSSILIAVFFLKYTDTLFPFRKTIKLILLPSFHFWYFIALVPS